jgi:heterodisulfide reductase subunit B
VIELEYTLFLGCIIPYREVSYEVSARRIAKALGITLKEMPDANCCGLPLEPMNHEMTLALAARDLCIAEETGLNIMTLCNGCTGTLKKVNKTLKEDRDLRKKVNSYLNENGMEFKGEIEVKHLVHVLSVEVGLDTLQTFVTKPLEMLTIAGFIGCHLFRPSKYTGEKNPENPSLLNDLIEVTGAKSIHYLDALQCCGYLGSGIDKRLPLLLAREKLRNVKKAGADTLVTICPSCHLNFDINQRRLEKTFSESYDIPVLHYPQLLGLALGISPEELAFQDLRVKATKLLESVI